MGVSRKRFVAQNAGDREQRAVAGYDRQPGRNLTLVSTRSLVRSHAAVTARPAFRAFTALAFDPRRAKANFARQKPNYWRGKSNWGSRATAVAPSCSDRNRESNY